MSSNLASTRAVWDIDWDPALDLPLYDDEAPPDEPLGPTLTTQPSPFERWFETTMQLESRVVQASKPPNFDLYSQDLDRQPSSSKLIIREMIGNAEAEDSVAFVHCLLMEGDVRVFVDVPTTHADPRRRTGCDGVAPASQSFLMHSDKLLKLKDSKFATMLENEIYQARVKRRRKPNEEMMKGVRYLLDLTPPTEGDDLVFQMTELSLPIGIIKWWNAHQLFPVPQRLVDGHDDLCACRIDAHVRKMATQARKESAQLDADKLRRILIEENRESESSDPSISTSNAEDRAIAEAVSNAVPSALITNEDSIEEDKITLPPKPEDLLRYRAQGRQELLETPSHYQLPEYCPVRHCNALVRLCMMIEGKSVKLTSAARMWTMVSISKIMECTTVVRDQVAQWILANSPFIEVLPEAALSIGFALELPQVTQSAFRILVNELALEEASDVGVDRKRKVSIFGRALSDPGDEMSNLIQHAARALVERVTEHLKHLRNPDVLDFWASDNWTKLRQIESLLVTENDGSFHFGEALESVRLLMKAISYEVNRRVEKLILDTSYCRGAYPQMDQDRARYVEPQNYEQIQHIVPNLNLTQRLLLPFFYNELGRSFGKSLFFGQKSWATDSYGVFFHDLVVRLEQKLQALVDQNPARAHWGPYQVLFGNTPSSLWPSSGAKFSPTVRPVAVPVIDLSLLSREVKDWMRPYTTSWMRLESVDPPANYTRHLLLTLTNNEMKFLPLWAGGNDDGTGGVFETFLPDAEMGPNGPGPAYHTGMTLPSAPPSMSESLLDEISGMEIRGSTTAGSIDVHDSVSTVYRPEKVITEDESIASESFDENDFDYDHAKFAVPAGHQPMGQTIDMLVHSTRDDDFMDDSASDATIGAFESEGDAGSDVGVTEIDNKSAMSSSDGDSMVMV